MISLQNGLGNLEKIVELLGKDKAIGGRVIFGAEIIEPGRVKVTVYADKVVLGGVKDGIDLEKVEEIAETFSLSGIPSQTTREIEKYIWGKVLYNGALNALGSILEVNYGELLKHEETKTLMSEIVAEIFKVIKKENIQLFWSEAEEYLTLLFNELIPATHDHFPSMLQDIKNKRKTEIASINGTVVRKGEELGLSLPINKIVTNLVKVKERIAILHV
jgi:2-dehydropantoate 2-reductase